MARIHVIGGTGYAGSHIAQEAARRGHEVTSYSRHRPQQPVEGVTYRTGDVTDEAFLATAFQDADVAISALSPRGALAEGDVFRRVEQRLAALAAESGVRLGVIGGAGSLHVAPGGPLLVDTPDFPDAARPESQTLGQVLEDLRANDDDRLDWFLVSPGAAFGAQAPGEATGRYRVGDDVLLADSSGSSAISGADLALAVVDEIETPAHRRTRFTVAY